MKSFAVSAFFPEVKPAHHAWGDATVKASNITIAATRGLAAIRKAPALKRKVIREVRLTVKMLQ